MFNFIPYYIKTRCCCRGKGKPNLGEKKIHRIHKNPTGMEVMFDSEGNAAVHSHWEFPTHFDKIISQERDFSVPDTLQKPQVPRLAELRPCSQARAAEVPVLRCLPAPLREEGAPGSGLSTGNGSRQQMLAGTRPIPCQE